MNSIKESEKLLTILEDDLDVTQEDFKRVDRDLTSHVEKFDMLRNIETNILKAKLSFLKQEQTALDSKVILILYKIFHMIRIRLKFNLSKRSNWKRGN